MIAVLHLLQPDVFLSWRNVTNIFKQVSWQSMLALGVFMGIVTAGIDLSVGSIIMLSLMGLAIASKAGMPWYVVMLVAPAIGFLCGMFNGIGITLLRMPHPFIMTLGTLYIFRGIGNLISGGVPITGFAEQIIAATLNLLYTFGYQGEPMSQLEFLTRTLGSITVILGGLFLLINKLK